MGKEGAGTNNMQHVPSKAISTICLLTLTSSVSISHKNCYFFVQTYLSKMLHVIIKITQQRSRNFNAKDDVRIIGTPWWCFSIIYYLLHPAAAAATKRRRPTNKFNNLML
jgi:hypothetical protein